MIEKEKLSQAFYFNQRSGVTAAERHDNDSHLPVTNWFVHVNGTVSYIEQQSDLSFEYNAATIATWLLGFKSQSVVTFSCYFKVTSWKWLILQILFLCVAGWSLCPSSEWRRPGCTDQRQGYSRTYPRSSCYVY